MISIYLSILPIPGRIVNVSRHRKTGLPVRTGKRRVPSFERTAPAFFVSSHPVHGRRPVFVDFHGHTVRLVEADHIWFPLREGVHRTLRHCESPVCLTIDKLHRRGIFLDPPGFRYLKLLQHPPVLFLRCAFLRKARQRKVTKSVHISVPRYSPAVFTVETARLPGEKRGKPLHCVVFHCILVTANFISKKLNLLVGVNNG